MSTMARGEIGLGVWLIVLDETRRGLVGSAKRTDGSFSNETSDTTESSWSGSGSGSGSGETGFDISVVGVASICNGLDGGSLVEASRRGLAVCSKRTDGSFSKDASETSDSVSLVFVCATVFAFAFAFAVALSTAVSSCFSMLWSSSSESVSSSS